MLEPFSIPFNAACVVHAARCWPQGFNSAPAAPATLAALCDEVDGTGRLTVWDGASGETIFGDPEINLQFRAWHDWAHWRYRLPFDMNGETAAAFVQAAQLTRTHGPDPELLALLFCEVIGQAHFYQSFGAFPDDQRSFCRVNRRHYEFMAHDFAVFVEDYDGGEVSDQTAIDWARVRQYIKLRG